MSPTLARANYLQTKPIFKQPTNPKVRGDCWRVQSGAKCLRSLLTTILNSTGKKYVMKNAT